MSDLGLDEKEQNHVRTALRYLRRRYGAWRPVAEALHFGYDTINKTVNGRDTVSVNLAFRVARLAGVPLDDLISGSFVPGACPKCGHVPDFADEPTFVEDAPPRLGRGIAQVK